MCLPPKIPKRVILLTGSRKGEGKRADMVGSGDGVGGGVNGLTFFGLYNCR